MTTKESKMRRKDCEPDTTTWYGTTAMALRVAQQHAQSSAIYVSLLALGAAFTTVRMYVNLPHDAHLSAFGLFEVSAPTSISFVLMTLILAFWLADTTRAWMRVVEMKRGIEMVDAQEGYDAPDQPAPPAQQATPSAVISGFTFSNNHRTGDGRA